MILFMNVLNECKTIAASTCGRCINDRMVDCDVAVIKASFWSRDCWIEPIIDVGKENQWRDSDWRGEPSLEDQLRLMTMFSAAGRVFEVPVWYARIPYRQIFEGAHVAKRFTTRAAFDREVSLGLGMNDAIPTWLCLISR